MARPKSTIEQRIAYFESQVDRSGGPDACHIWQAGKNKSGYGRLGRGGRGAPVVLAHRFAWEVTKGTIPDGLNVLHNCPDGDNPACVNIRHLWLGTHADNVADKVTKGRHAHGETSGARVRPERVARGNKHGSRHPLTAEQVVALRVAHKSGAATAKELATRYSLAITSIWRILRRERWAHLP